MASVLDGLIKGADLRPDVQLQPHQQHVLDRLKNHPGRMLLMHSLGSGKTLTGIGAAEQEGDPYTIIAPASLRNNAKKELAKFTTDPSRANVMSYTALAKNKPVLNSESLIADEAQRLRNPASLQTQRFLELARQAKQVTLLSGTPIVNDPSDLAVPLSVLANTKPDPKSFHDRFVGTKRVFPGIWNWLRGVPFGQEPVVKHPEELKALLKGHVDYYAPEKTTVPTQHEDIPVEMSTDQARLYRAMFGQLPWLLRWKLQHDYPVTSDELKRMQSFLAGPRQVGLSTYPFMGARKNPLKAFKGSTKLQEAFKRLNETLQDKRTKALVFSNFIDAGLVPYSAGLEAAHIPHAVFHGGLSDKERKKLVDDYNIGKIRVALLGPSGTEGLSFKGTQLTQLLDPHFQAVRGRQAEGRALRYDSHIDLPEELQNVKVQRFISKLPLGLKDRFMRNVGFNRAPQQRAADDYLTNMSARKERLNAQFNKILQEVGTVKHGAHVYHGSPVAGLSKLHPRKSRILGGQPAVFATADRGLAISNIARWQDADFEQGRINEEPWYMQEQYPGAIEKRLKGAKGSLYKLPVAGFKQDPRLMRSESISDTPVTAAGEERIEDVYSALKDLGWDIRAHQQEMKVAKDKANDNVVYSYVPRSTLPFVQQYGLLGGKALLRRKPALEAAAAGRRQSTEELAANLRQTLRSWKRYQSLGPNVMFQPPPDVAKLSPKHPLRTQDLIPIKVRLSQLLKDQPATKLYGMELEPYDPVKHTKGTERHRYLPPKELASLLSKSPEELWASYSDPANIGYYAADVPHVAIHAPKNTVSPKYLELPFDEIKTAEDNAKNWVRHVMQTSFATAPPQLIFTKTPQEIADAGDIEGVAPKGVTSWQRMVLFHRNRGGRKLSEERKKALQESIFILSGRIKERRAQPDLYDPDTLLPLSKGAANVDRNGSGHRPADTADSGYNRAAGDYGRDQEDSGRQLLEVVKDAGYSENRMLVKRADNNGSVLDGLLHDSPVIDNKERQGSSYELKNAAAEARSGVSNIGSNGATGIPDRSVYGDPAALRPSSLVDYFVSRHDARRAGKHTDIRLGLPETGLLSWAARKGLPEPGKKHLAVQQPLHEHSYGGWEGTIPSGYGAGAVKNEDVGKALITRAGPEGIHFTTAHRRFPERYALIPPRAAGSKNWLLLNTTKTTPIPYEKVHYTNIPAEHAEAVLSKLAPGSSVQAKIDGAAALVQLLKNHAEVLSYRRHKSGPQAGWPIVHTERTFHGRPEIAVPPKYRNTVLRSELYGVNNRGHAIPPQELGGILNSTVANAVDTQRQKGIQLRNLIFDLEQLKGKPTTHMSYADRLVKAKEVSQHLPQGQFDFPEDVGEANTPEDALKLWKRIATGKHPLTQEGVVIHRPDKKPAKIKLRGEHDVHIREFFPGKGKYEGNAVGGFRYSHEPEGDIVGEVGTGLSDALRRDMHANPNLYLGRVARVLAQRKTQSGALYAPALLALHEDI